MRSVAFVEFSWLGSAKNVDPKFRTNPHSKPNSTLNQRVFSSINRFSLAGEPSPGPQ